MTLSLVIVTISIFATPMLLSRLNISIVPTSVAEIIIGIILGKSCLNLIHMNNVLSNLSTLGIIFLMFLSGIEIDFSIFKKNIKKQMTPLEIKNASKNPRNSVLKTAIISYVYTIVTAIIIAFGFKIFNLFSNITLSVILFSTTALGLVISILKENELLSNEFGQTLLLIAVMGEVIPLITLTIYSSVFSQKGESLWLISFIFIIAALLLRHFRKFFTFFNKINKSTTQLDMRLALLIIITLVVISEMVGAENILGAFVAGIVVKLLQPEESTQQKLDSIGYGLFIPYFFILTGVKLNISSILSSPKTLILIPLFFIAFIVTKMPSFFGLKLSFSSINSFAGSMLSSVTITLVLATLSVAQQLNAINTQQSGAFIIAGIITCILGPILFNKLYKPEYSNIQKTKVSVIGANILTIPAVQQVSKDLYNVTIYTNKKLNYHTYHSQANVQYINSLNTNELIKKDIFDTDILVLAYNSNVNYNLAINAKNYGIKEIVAYMEDQNDNDNKEEKLNQMGIYTINKFSMDINILRTAIESPSMLKLLSNGTNARIYEVTLNNELFNNYEISQLPFIKQITISRIFRKHNSIAPHGSTRLQLNDHIIFLGERNIAKKVKKILGKLNEE